MQDSISFGSWRFAHDLRTATHTSQSEQIKFTRAEHNLLDVFMRNAGTVLTRERLLDAAWDVDSDVSDRSVDFTINRLRRKLHDSARDPNYIATTYGEGYRWIAKPTATEQPSSGAFIVVGPIHGVHANGHLTPAGWAFAKELTKALKQRFERDRTVTLETDCPPVDSFVGSPPQFQVALDFVETNDEELECAVTLKQFRQNVILNVTRIAVRRNGVRTASEHMPALQLAATVCDDIWRQLHRVEPRVVAPETQPLSVRLHSSALLFAKGSAAREHIRQRIDTLMHEHPIDYASVYAQVHALRAQRFRAVQETEGRLREELRKSPDDHEMALSLATTLHSRYVVGGADALMTGDRRARDEAEIESLVTTAVPYLQDRGMLQLSAAKLLYFLQSGYERMAMDMAETVFQSTTALATAFATLGQLRAWDGAINEAVALYDHGLELAKPDSEFWRYLLILKCQALAAGGDHESQASTAAELFRSAPGTGTYLGLFYTVNGKYDQLPELQPALTQMNEREAQATLMHVHYVCARQFRLSVHRQNTLRRPLLLLISKFGTGFIPREVRLHAPHDVLTGNCGSACASRCLANTAGN